jgi:hypothetical protein
MKELLIALALSLGAAASSSAQVTPLLGTGCPGLAAVAVSGPPRVGTTVNFDWRCPGTDVPLIVFGDVIRPPIPLPPLVICGGGFFCMLGVQPVVSIQGAVGVLHSIPVPIPNNPELIGAVIGAQGVCVGQLPGLCLSLSQAIAVRVQA